VTAFGRDAITIQDPATIHAAGDDAERAESAPDHDMLGKPLLSERGDGLGKVVDVDFDVRTGEVIALITDRDEIAGRLLLGVGSYAVVVAIDEPPDPGA
jgi:sporulation protein YlmC with PRC-barrel domain